METTKKNLRRPTTVRENPDVEFLETVAAPGSGSDQ